MKKGLLLSLSLMLMLMPFGGLANAPAKPTESKIVEPSTLNESVSFTAQYVNYKKQSLVLEIAEQETKASQAKKDEKQYPLFEVNMSDDMQKVAWELSKEFDVPVKNIIAIASIETGGTFNPKLTHKNKDGTTDYGLMQLNNGGTMQWLAKESSIKDFQWNNPEHNLRAGVWYLKNLKDRWKSEGYKGEDKLMALAALSYNMGYGGAKKYIKSHDVFDWQYVNKMETIKNGLQLRKGDSGYATM